MAVKALTSFSLGRVDGTRVPINAGDVLPDDWVAVNPHQVDQMVVSGNAVRLPS